MKHQEGQTFCFDSIGLIHTPFKDKFGIPRQPGLVPQAKGLIKINDDLNLKTALRSLEDFSHIWIVFVFHEHGGRNWRPSVRPPRLGGTRKVGVLASRSPHRPNPIGLSAVRLERVDLDAKGGPEIHVAAVDLLDGTPVLDVKPYLPYADAIPSANSGWAAEVIERTEVELSTKAEAQLVSFAKGVRELILQILALDPRPAFQKRQRPVADPASWGLCYGITILDYDVKYEIQEGKFWIREILSLRP